MNKPELLAPAESFNTLKYAFAYGADSDVVGGLNADMDVVWIDTDGTDHRFDNNPRVHRVKSVLEYFKL